MGSIFLFHEIQILNLNNYEYYKYFANVYLVLGLRFYENL